MRVPYPPRDLIAWRDRMRTGRFGDPPRATRILRTSSPNSGRRNKYSNREGISHGDLRCASPGRLQRAETLDARRVSNAARAMRLSGKTPPRCYARHQRRDRHRRSQVAMGQRALAYRKRRRRRLGHHLAESFDREICRLADRMTFRSAAPDDEAEHAGQSHDIVRVAIRRLT